MPKFQLLQTDKVAHAAAYGLLAWLTLWGFARWKGEVKVLHGIITVLVCSSIGAFLEYIQFRYFPDRVFEYDDMTANAIGAIGGWWIFSRIFSHRHLEAWLSR